VIVFDREGNFLGSWGKAYSVDRMHSDYAEDIAYCTDDKDIRSKMHPGWQGSNDAGYKGKSSETATMEKT